MIGEGSGVKEGQSAPAADGVEDDYTVEDALHKIMIASRKLAKKRGQATTPKLEILVEKLWANRAELPHAAQQACECYAAEVSKEQPNNSELQRLEGLLEDHIGRALDKSFYSKLRELESASQFANDPRVVKRARLTIELQGGNLLNCRPYTERGVPLALLSKAFAAFIEKVRSSDNTPTTSDMDMARALITTCSQLVADERVDLQEPLLEPLTTYLRSLGPTILPSKKVESAPDFAVLKHDFLLALVELKRDTGGNSRAEVERYYLQRIGDVGKSPDQGRFLEHYCCPVFSVEINSATLRLGGLAMSNRSAFSEPFTDAMNLLFLSEEQVLRLSQVLCAWRQSLDVLVSEYEDAVERFRLPNPPGPAIPPILLAKYPDCSVFQPWPKRPLYKVTPQRDLSLTASHRKVELFGKFWSKTHADSKANLVHQSWAKAGVAIELVETDEVGGWQLSIMKCLDWEEGWATLRMYAPAARLQKEHTPSQAGVLPSPVSDAEWQELEKAAKEALARGHAEVVVDGKVAVHGDARLDNIVARRANDKWEVNFVDFGWAGVLGEARYPVFMSQEIQWPRGACPGRLITQELDMRLLEDELLEGRALEDLAS